MPVALKVPEPRQPNIVQPGEEEKSLVSGYLDQSKQTQERVAPIQQQMDKLGGEIGQIQPPPPPQIQKVPEYQPKQLDSGELFNFAGIAIGLAALASRAVKGDIALALNTAGEAMKGFSAGNLEQAKQNIAQFNTKMQSVIAQNNQQMQEYDRVMADRKLTLNQKMQQMSVLAHKFQDEIAIDALKNHKLEFLFNRNDKLTLANQNAELKRLQIVGNLELRHQQLEMMQQSKNIQIELMKMRMGIGPGGAASTSADQLKSDGAMAATGMPLNQVMPGYGPMVVQQRKAAKAAAIQQIMDQEKVDGTQAGVIFAQRQLNYAGVKGSVQQLQKMKGATVAAIQQLDFNVGKTTEAIDKLEKVGLGSSDLSPILNAIIRGEQKWTGAPEYAELFFYMSAAGKEAARIQAGGQASIAQLYEGARKEAEEWASAGFTTPSMWKQGVAPAMMLEGQNRLENYDLAIAGQLHGISDGKVPAPTQDIAVGTVMDGYRFKGGDKAKKENWEPVQ